jgi:beta-glucosidase
MENQLWKSAMENQPPRAVRSRRKGSRESLQHRKQPVTPGDAAQGVVQRVFFPAGATITPNLTVSLSDQTLVGYVTKGQSTPLPPGMTVCYSSDRPGTVGVAPGGRSLTAVAPGPATITATVSYHGKTATGTAVIYVQNT